MTDTRNDEQYELAQKMTAEYGKVLDLCQHIVDRNAYVSHWNEWDEMIDRIIDEHIGDPLEITATLTMPIDVYNAGLVRVADYVDSIDVLLGTGGPARGIRFYDADRAECWHQNWWVPKAFAPLDSAAAEFLANHWGLFE